MKLKVVLGFLLSGVFLYFALRGIQWAEFAEVLGRTDIALLVLGSALAIAGHWFRSYRWKFTLLPLTRATTASLFAATAIGFMANNLLPARIGEVIRAHLAGSREGISRAGAFATIVYERMVDVFVLLLLLAYTLGRVPGPPWLKQGGQTLLVLNGLLLIAMVVMSRYEDRLGRLFDRLAARYPHRLVRAGLGPLRSFLTGLRVVGQLGPQAVIALTSILVWGFPLLRIYVCFLAIDMEVPLDAGVTVLVFVSLAAMIPSAPAYLGTIQYACVLALAIYGVPKSEALAFSVVYHFTQVVPITVVGMIYLWREHAGLGELRRRSAGPADPAAEG